MTVEQDESKAIVQTKTVKILTKEERQCISQIQEVTGVQDIQLILDAMRRCSNVEGRFDMCDVIGLLVPLEQSSKDTQVVPTSCNASCNTDSLGPLEETAKVPQTVIDLTRESNEQDDIQKAIAASLQDTQGVLGSQVVSKEDIEVSRVLEASLADSKAGTKRKRGDLWFVDPLNPHERKRKPCWPVGLKNVGNTCWFSAVIQSLFHLPLFRAMVLQFKHTESHETESPAGKRNLMFMKQLRELFAYLVATDRKYVDPCKAVDILKEAFSSSGTVADAQQDVSEFQHKLLEWLEEAFASRREPGEPTTSNCAHTSSGLNPVKDLFYGQVKTEGVNEGNRFTNEETFGQFPLQVVNFKDIHESLENATAQGEIEALRDDLPASGQEQWFTRLPPVLTFELSRFQFNQHLARPEKVHNKLTFPSLLYMDRYLEENKDITRNKREQVKKLKEKLSTLHQRLDRYMNYGSGDRKFPLQHILQYAMEFAQSKTTDYTDVEMMSPKSEHSKYSADSPVSSPESSSLIPDVAMTTPKREETADLTQHMPTSTTKMAASTSSLTLPPETNLPVPGHISLSEQTVLQDCLQRWRLEVESNVRDDGDYCLQHLIGHFTELQEVISSLEGSVNDMYDDEQLQKHGYKLHAVLVHEGQAASGHYWAYVYDNTHNTWLKCNDISVTETTWEELEKESAGGYHNTSAYCLMYVGVHRDDLFCINRHKENETGAEFLAKSFAALPVDLKNLIGADNDHFAREIQNWDAEQCKLKKADKEILLLSEKKQASPSSSAPTKTSLAMVHAQHASSQTQVAVSRALTSKAYLNKQVDTALKEAIEAEFNRLEELANKVETSLPFSDPRLTHIVVYIAASTPTCYSMKALPRILLEHFAMFRFGQGDHSSGEDFIQAAIKVLEDNKKSSSEEDRQQYKAWHEDYSWFRKVVALFLQGLESFHEKRYQEALPYFLHACIINNKLLKGGVMKGMDSNLLGYYRRQCVLHLNENAALQFESGVEVGETLSMMSDLVMPCLQQLSLTSSSEDATTVDEIRLKWCSFLGLELQRVQQEKLQDFLAKLLDPPSEVRIKMPLVHSFQESQNIYELYKKNITLVKEHGYELEADKS